jgi:hypothetical protein
MLHGDQASGVMWRLNAKHTPIVAFAGRGYGENPAFSGFASIRGGRFTWNYALACFDPAENP